MSLQQLVRPSIGRSGSVRPQLSANELVTRIVDAFYEGRLAFFSANWAAETLKLPLGYTQRLLCRLTKRGLLSRRRFPRLLRAGYHRGFLNLYAPTQEGCKRANWYRRSNSLVAFQYLATGRGTSGELTRSCVVNRVADELQKCGLPLRIHSRDPRSLEPLLGLLTHDAICFASTPRLSFSFEALRKQGLLPEDLSPLFPHIAKGAYGCTNEQTLLALLYRSAIYWKTQYEISERKNAANAAAKDPHLKPETETKQSPPEQKNTTEDTITHQVQNIYLKTQVSELSRQVDKLRSQIRLNNLGMTLVCTTLEPVRHISPFTSPVVKYVEKELNYLQTTNIVTLWT